MSGLSVNHQPLQVIGTAGSTLKKSIRNVMARTKFKNILQNWIFYNNTKADNSNNSYKVRLLITNFDKKFSQYAPNWALKTLMSTC